jgi:hypothetical protein
VPGTGAQASKLEAETASRFVGSLRDACDRRGEAACEPAAVPAPKNDRADFLSGPSPLVLVLVFEATPVSGPSVSGAGATFEGAAAATTGNDSLNPMPTPRPADVRPSDEAIDPEPDPAGDGVVTGRTGAAAVAVVAE